MRQPAAADPDASAAAPAPVADHSREDAGVLRGTFARHSGERDDLSSDEEIAEFCKANHGVTFPMFSRTTVTGESAKPLFRRLTNAAGAPEWNFDKDLAGRRGKVVARFGASTDPNESQLTGRIEKRL